jgi:hypothetical protein
LNDGQIQNPSVQSYIAARSQLGWRGFGFVHHSRTLFCRAVPNPNITIRNFFIAVRCWAWSCPPRSPSTIQRWWLCPPSSRPSSTPHRPCRSVFAAPPYNPSFVPSSSLRELRSKSSVHQTGIPTRVWNDAQGRSKLGGVAGLWGRRAHARASLWGWQRIAALPRGPHCSPRCCSLQVAAPPAVARSPRGEMMMMVLRRPAAERAASLQLLVAGVLTGSLRVAVQVRPHRSTHPQPLTTLPKVDTNCTALSLMPTIIGNTFAASLRTDICPQRKEARPRLTL